MSRGLTDTPMPEEQDGLSPQEIEAALTDVADYVHMMSVRLQALEDLVARAISVNIDYEPEPNRINGL